MPTTAINIKNSFFIFTDPDSCRAQLLSLFVCPLWQVYKDVTHIFKKFNPPLQIQPNRTAKNISFVAHRGHIGMPYVGLCYH